MDALKTSFLPNLSIESTVVSNGHYCSMCGEQFDESQQAIEHMHLCHSGLSDATDVTDGSMMISSRNGVKVDYSCHSCDEKYCSIYELEEHLRLNHQNCSVLIRCPACNFYEMSTNSLEEPNVYKCGNCGCERSTTDLTDSESRFHSRTSDSTRPSSPEHSTKIRSREVHHYEQETISHNGQQHQQHNNTQTTHQTQQQRRKHHDRNGILKVPPLTVKLNKNNNSNSVLHPVVTIKEEPSNGDDAETPSIYAIHETPYPVNNVDTSTSQAHTSSNMNDTTSSAAPSVNKIRHKCPNCSKAFKTIGTLAIHRKIHTREAQPTQKQRRFPCTYCDKSFTQSNSLKLHTRIHTGEKPFQCSYCEKAFSVKDYLTKHIRTHTGEKPYPCCYCEKRFSQRSALTVHITKLHPL